MIYFISRQQRITDFDESEIQQGTVEQALEYFREKEFISLDTETTGFDPHKDKVLLLQLGDKENQFVFDETIDFTIFKEYLESKLILGQNIKFDLRFLFKLGIYPTKVYDTFLAEIKLTQGIQNTRRNLQALNEKYVGTDEVDKSLRGLIHRGISSIVIKYAANDVKPLEIIKEKQLQEAKALDLEKAIQLENEFCIPLAYTEFCGIFVDPAKWKTKVDRKTKELALAVENLNNYILDNKMFKYVDGQLDLFNPEAKPTITINWNSDKDVKKLFKELGINVTITEKGVEKESVDAKVLKPQLKDFEILPLYLNYKKLEKDVSTYGYKFLRQVNPNTGRIHTSFKQIVTTGRMASGGKNKATGEEYINLQNIPADSETRDCFTNQFDDTILVNCDYSGMESVVLTNVSKEINVIEFYQKGSSDLHSFVASKLFSIRYEAIVEAIRKKDEGEELSDDEKLYLKKRKIAKAANFALAYGGTGFTIAKNL